jgi:hypothetical protein
MSGLPKPRGYGACPTFFYATCRTASYGGRNSYEDAGYTLARNVSDLSPYDVDEEDWQTRLEELAALVADENDQAVLAWLKRYVPRCLAMVPSRRRQSLLRGIYRYANDDGNDIAEL